MAPPTRVCPSCDTPLPAEAVFCLMCGTKIGTVVAAPPADPLRDALEQAVGSQYEITRLLGRGGMGAVYLAKEPALDRLVAIKVLPPESSEKDTRERFRREARTAAKLTHPHIVPLHTFGEADGTMYFVMGFVQGESLGDLMRRKGTIPVDDARRVLAEIADALDYAHRQGVVHRDIKPDNILIDDDSGKALLTDFGIAKATASGSTLTEAGSVVGTVHYMSPEQASGEKHIDGRSDLYSLGVIGYAMLAGRLPFDGESAQEILVQHVTRDPIPLETLADRPPDDLVRVVRRAMAKAPEDRWPDGHSLREELATHTADSDQMPEVLFQFDGTGVWLMGPVAYALVLLVAMSELFQVPEGGLGWGVLSLVGAGPLFVAVQGLTMRWDKRYEHVSLSDYWAACFHQPKWWIGWYPKQWRRRSMMWHRLPKPVRVMRTMLMTGFVGTLIVGPATILPVLALGTASPFLRWLSRVALFAFGLPALGLGVLGVAGWWWRRKYRLKDPDLVGLLGFSSPPGFWKKPAILEVLKAEEPEGKRTAAPSAPDEFLTQISRLVNELTAPAREIGRQCIAAARQLVSSIEEVAREIERLSRDADPTEIAKLAERLLAFERELGAENDDERQMRELTQSQLDLMRRLAGRLEAAQDRKTRMLNLLKTLWLQVADLRAQSAQEEFDGSEISGKIRSLNEEIEIYVESAKEAETLLQSGEA